MRGKKRRAYAWIVLILLALAFAPPAFAHHQPNFRNLRRRVDGLEFQVAALQAAGVQQTGPQGAQGPQGPAGTNGTDGTDGTDGEDGEDGAAGADGQDGVSGYQVFTSVQDFGPGGIGGAWCGAPNANTTDQGWIVLGGGAQLTATDVDNGFAIAGEWPHTTDPLNPGWNIQLNKPANQNPGNVTLYVVCAKEPV